MRRAVPTLVATLAGLGLLAGFRTSTGQAVAAGPTSATVPPPTAGATPPAGAPPSESSSTAPSTTAAGARRTVDGSDITNRYGDVQVRVTLQDSKIIDVQALALPNDRERSAEISDYAGPRLRQEALRAQSANIDLLSGATYTSESYQQSLQSALDKAGVR
ncbi:MAG TPA: FMN-binding protein [Acidimicrobiales bacterium]|nr:FMN-binding protein [Acidimicrobiales bacterium]